MVKCAIIGFGSIAQDHLEGYKRNSNVQIVAVSDITSQRLQLAKEKLKLEDKRLYTDYKKMLSEVQADFVDICLPHVFHKDAVVTAAKHGFHVLSEKPLAMTLIDIDDMIQATKDSGVELMVCHNYMYFPPCIRAKEIIDEGELGRVIYYEWRAFSPSYFIGAREFRPSWRATAKTAGGGPMFDNALHPCYLANWFINSIPIYVKGTVDNLNRSEYSTEDFGHAFYRYPNDSLAEIMASWGVSRRSSSRRIECEKGTVYVPFFGELTSPIRIHFDGETREMVVPRKEEFVGVMRGDFWYSYERLIGEFVSVISEGKKPSFPITAQDGKKAVEMVLASYESGALGREIPLPLRVDDPVYQKGIAGLQDLDIPKDNPIYKKNIFEIRG